MKFFVSRLAAIVLTLSLVGAYAGCQSLYVKRVKFENHPIAVRILSKVVDEETIDYTVVFRNVGREVVSFDYTIADEPGVPHIDSQGPNSGLIENLYPGAEVEVENPTKKMAVWITLGEVVYGKRDKGMIQQVFTPGQGFGTGGELDLPPL